MTLPRQRVVTVADLFCGAGGTSTGACQAIRELGHIPKLTAINHWQVAVDSHSANHPGQRHLCASVDSLNPRHLFAEGELDILWGSPECTHHSRARGGKPMKDQSRATAWCITRWAEALRPDIIFVENVPEFAEWGPLGSNSLPLISRRGETFRAWLETLRSIGYRVDHRILCAADYGDPTTRKRLFIQAVRGRRKIVWPEPTHQPTNDADLFTGTLPRWRAARDVVDWSIPGRSIYGRKKPLAPKTLARIAEGLRKYGIKPSVVMMEHGGRVMDADHPLPTITTARGGAMAIVEPFLLPQQSCGILRSVSLPCPTISTSGAIALIEPCLLPQHSGTALRSIEEPFPTVCGSGSIALVEPFLVKYYGTATTIPIDEPLDTVTTKDRFGLALPEVTLEGERYRLDIRFRMLTPGELTKAQGFPSEYRFSGTKTEQVRQIGNAVPCGFARALVRAALG